MSEMLLSEKPGRLHSQDSEQYQVKVLSFNTSMVRNEFLLQIGSIILPLIALESNTFVQSLGTGRSDVRTIAGYFILGWFSDALRGGCLPAMPMTAGAVLFSCFE